MQIVDRKNIEKRLLYYWSKMYSKGIQEGEDYEKLSKAIVILFSDYKLEKLKNIDKYITKWNIREEENVQTVLTDDMEIYIIELPKFKKNGKKDNETRKLDSWINFIEKPEVDTVGEGNEKIKKAKEVLEEISQDEREAYLAELREKYIMDQKAIEGAGFDKGMKQGIEQGIEMTAKKMKQEKISIDTICKVTGLTKEEIEKL
jgi:predicted transposase/invertase (TIGR01784 family)